MQTPTIELITEATCPNVASAREVIQAACARVGVSAQWREWDVADAQLPSHAVGFGSPTILINGRDVAGASPDNSACCRLYDNPQRGTPSVEQVISALRESLSAAD